MRITHNKLSSDTRLDLAALDIDIDKYPTGSFYGNEVVVVNDGEQMLTCGYKSETNCNECEVVRCPFNPHHVERF